MSEIKVQTTVTSKGKYEPIRKPSGFKYWAIEAGYGPEFYDNEKLRKTYGDVQLAQFKKYG